MTAHRAAPRAALLCACALLVAGCETTAVQPVDQPGFQLAVDERRLWQRAQQEQETIERSGFIAAWPEVESYLTGVMHGLRSSPLQEGTPLRVRIVIDPTLNAFVLPNGSLYVHTGLLARLENEAQLAAVVAHEITHATHRHGLKTYRSVKNHTAFLAAFTAGTGGLGSLLGGLGVLASVSGYSQELEREADLVGLQLVVAAGYDPREAPKVFQILREESKRSKLKEPFFFGSHPKLTDRIQSFQQLVASLPESQRRGRTEAAAYEAILPRVLVGNAEAALSAGDFEFAQHCAERALQLRPGDVAAEYQLAETARRRGGENDAASARARYEAILEREPDHAAAHRGLGLTALQQGDKARAAAAFERYLTLAPAATDRGYIQAYLQQCRSAP